MQLPSTTPYRKEKLKILSSLDNEEEGLSANEISDIIKKKTTVTNQILNELISLSMIYTNGKKQKEESFLRQNKKSIVLNPLGFYDAFLDFNCLLILF